MKGKRAKKLKKKIKTNKEIKKIWKLLNFQEKVEESSFFKKRKILLKNKKNTPTSNQ
jgi:hypothetical protein